MLGDSQTSTWLLFISLTILHVYANYAAISGLVLKTINRQRAFILCQFAIQNEGRGMLLCYVVLCLCLLGMCVWVNV